MPDSVLSGTTGDAVARILLKYAWSPEVLDRLEALPPRVVSPSADPDPPNAASVPLKSAFVEGLVRAAQNLEVEQLTDFVTRAATEEIEELAMTIAEKLERRGELRGERKGELKGRRLALLQLITLKFGPPGAEVEARVMAASDEEVERIMPRILSAESLTELLAD